MIKSYLSISCTLLSLATLPQAWSGTLQNNIVPGSNKSIDNLKGSYAHPVFKNGITYYFSNARPKNKGAVYSEGMQLWQGYESSPSFIKTVAPNSIINDLKLPNGSNDPTRMFTRGVTAVSKRDGKFYILAHVSRGYPPSDGRVVPALLVSKTTNPADGFIYKGKLTGDGFSFGGWTSGMTLIINDDVDPQATVLDDVNPMKNRFVFYNEMSGGVRLFYSQDGSRWRVYKNKYKSLADIRPEGNRAIEPKGWIFNSAVKTPHGYFMYVSYNWITNKGPEGHHLMYSSNGINWKIIGVPFSGAYGQRETRIAGEKHPKNATLGYNESTNDVYVLVTKGSGGSYYKGLAKFKARSFGSTDPVDIRTPATPEPPLVKPSQKCDGAKSGFRRGCQ